MSTRPPTEARIVSWPQAARVAGLLFGWLAALTLTLPWVAKWEPSLPPRRLPDQAHGYWLATEIYDDSAPAGVAVAIVLPLGTVAVLVLLHLAATRVAGGWFGLATSGVAIALLIVARVGIDLYVSETAVGYSFVLEPGWYVWRAAMLGCIVAGVWIADTNVRSTAQVDD